MSKLIDLTGMRFGRLTVIERAVSTKKSNASWLCKCDCGNTRVVHGHSLRSGHTVSCGCYNDFLIQIVDRDYGLVEKS